MALENFSFARDDAILATVRAPRSPYGEEEEQPDAAHDHQDHADRVEVHPFRRDVDGEGENGSRSKEEQTHADTHVIDLPVSDDRGGDIPAPHWCDVRGVPVRYGLGNEAPCERSDSYYSGAGSGATVSNWPWTGTAISTSQLS